MMTHNSRSAKLQTIYLWRAWQSEPGMEGAACRATLTNERPSHPAPVQAYPGLVYQESLYDDWHLIGTCTGFLIEGTLPGETLIENRNGAQWDVEQIIAGGRYRQSKV